MKLSQRKILLCAIASIASAIVIFLIFLPRPSEPQPQGFDTTVPDGRPAELGSKAEAYSSAPSDTVSGDTSARDTVSTVRAAIDSSVSYVRRTVESMNSPLTDYIPQTDSQPERKPASSRPSYANTSHAHAQHDEAPSEPHDVPVQQQNVQKDTVEKRREFSGESSAESRSVQACIHQDQKVIEGSRVLIRTTEDGILDGIALKSGTILTGIAEFSGCRVRILITSVRTPDGIRKTDLSVYDSDSQEGIYWPQLSSEKAARSTGSALSKRIASTLSSSGVGSVIADGGASYISERIERQQARLTADYKVTLQAR